MNGEVDVINVIWRDGAYYVDRPNWDGGKVVPFEAVAELIEADREYDRAKEQRRYTPSNAGLQRVMAIREYHAAIARRAAALARLTGAA